MALVPCKDCGVEYSTTASSCPKCGAVTLSASSDKKDANRRSGWIVILLGVLFILLAFKIPLFGVPGIIAVLGGSIWYFVNRP